MRRPLGHVPKRSEIIQRIRDCQGLCRDLMDAWTLLPLPPLSSRGSGTPRWSAIHASRHPRVPFPAASRRQATGWLPTSQQTRDKTGCGYGQAPRRLWYIPAAVLGRSLPFVGFVPWEALVRVTCLPSTTEVRPALFASRPTHRGEAWPCLHALHVGMPARQHLGCRGRDDESSTTAWVVSCHHRTLLGWERSFACHTVSRFREPHRGRGCAVRVCPVRPVHGCPDGGSVRPSPWSSRPRSEAMRVA